MSIDKMYVIMSGGLKMDGSLPEHVIERCDWVINSCNSDQLSNNINILCSSSFTLNVPPKLNQENFVVSESSMIFEYLKKRGLKNKILCEQFSHDTVGSIFFSIDLFVLPMNIKTVSFVTSSFHRARVNSILNLIAGIYPNKFHFNTIGVESNEGSNQYVSVDKRISHETEAISNFKILYEEVNNRSDFLKVLLNEHSNYNYLYEGRICDDDEFY
jgi:hypothetical protein